MSKDYEQRRKIMRSVKSKNTTPEMQVRRLLHSLGYRYRLHKDNLPGRPDIVFTKKKKAIFVNGCFWHGHDCKRGKRIPKSNREYWIKKINRNRERDIYNVEMLLSKGWKVLILWECELKDKDKLRQRLIDFLNS